MLRALDVPAFAIKSPIVIGKLLRRDGLALDELAFMNAHTDSQSKFHCPVPARIELDVPAQA